mmetsp:Transcript_8760/g.32314  ORF Transcript_8760/g.32314 Transcript_8760/m.32314 type:complete len:304 (+) Transcript_8760:126-1037(+)
MMEQPEVVRYSIGALFDLQPHRCAACGASFRNAQQLRVHAKSHRPPGPPRVLPSGPAGESKALLQCPCCDKVSRNVTDLRKHYLRKHSVGEPPFRCPVCGRGYFVRADCRQHLKHCAEALAGGNPSPATTAAATAGGATAAPVAPRAPARPSAARRPAGRAAGRCAGSPRCSSRRAARPRSPAPAANAPARSVAGGGLWRPRERRRSTTRAPTRARAPPRARSTPLQAWAAPEPRRERARSLDGSARCPRPVAARANKAAGLAPHRCPPCRRRARPVSSSRRRACAAALPPRTAGAQCACREA